MNVKAIGIHTDVRNVAALEVLVTAAYAEFGDIDVLVNNAGINNVLPYHCLNIEDIQNRARQSHSSDAAHEVTS